MDTAQWPQQGIGVVKASVESSERQPLDRRVRPNKEQALNCPRCNSTNTKFCYYNNYSLSQPRYFCKTCRRYWTEGGSLRNVPVGGGSRKNKRSSSSSSSTPTLASSTSATTITTTPPSSSSTNLQPPELLTNLATSKYYQGVHDLNLSFPNQIFMERSGITARGLSPFAPVPMQPGTGSLYGSGFGFQELMRSDSNMKLQPLEGVGGSGYSGSMQEGGDGRLLFPFEDLKQVNMRNSSSHEAVVQGQGDPTLFWNGIIGNGGGTGNGGGGGGSW